MPDLLLDSVALIDYLNDIDQARTYVNTHASQSIISAVAAAEVLTGVDSEGVAPTMRFLDRFPLLKVDRTAAVTAARLRREHGWKLPDAFQAALAQKYDLQLVTRNTKDFDPSTHDFVVVPYRLDMS